MRAGGMPSASIAERTVSARCSDRPSLASSPPTRSVWPITWMSGAGRRRSSSSTRCISPFESSVSSSVPVTKYSRNEAGRAGMAASAAPKSRRTSSSLKDSELVTCLPWARVAA